MTDLHHAFREGERQPGKFVTVPVPAHGPLLRCPMCEGVLSIQTDAIIVVMNEDKPWQLIADLADHVCRMADQS